MSSLPKESQWPRQRTTPAPSQAPSPTTAAMADPASPTARHLPPRGAQPAEGDQPSGSVVHSPSRGLDSLLYNFYTKTIAVITASRLTHWHDLEAFESQANILEGVQTDVLVTEDSQGPSLIDTLDASASTPPAPATKLGTTGSGSTVRKMNRWFGLLLPELEIFKEEASLWRRLSNFIPQSALEASIENPADDQGAGTGRTLVPPLILDVIFDPTQLGKEHSLVLVESRSHTDSHTGRQHPVATSPPPETLEILHRPIVLERWRIDFNVFPPDVPPDIRAVYQRCISHFRSLYSLTRSLPTQRLYRRLGAARLEAAARRLKQNSSGSHIQHFYRYDDLLQVGCRLGAGELDEEDEAKEFELRFRFDVVRPGSERSSVGDGEGDSALETNIQGFSPIITPLGSLNVSVEYRLDVDFRVETAEGETRRSSSRPLSTVEMTSEVASIDLQPDEDYFRPPTGPPSHGSVSSDKSAGIPTKHGAEDSFKHPQVISQPIPMSPYQASSDQPLRSPSSASNPSPSSSLFSQSAPGRPRLPPAGLSSLRHQSSIAAMVQIGGANAIDVASSGNVTPASALATALRRSPSTGEPAFLTNSVRRASMGERKLRTLSNVGYERPSPPSPSTAAAIRPPISHPMRFGSYSPSSSSPLAQRLSASQSHRHSQSSQGYNRVVSYASSSAAGNAGGSISLASSESRSPNLSLRSVFQDYLPRSHDREGAIPRISNRQSISASTSSASRPILQRQVSGGSEERTSSVSSLTGGSIGGGSTSGTVSIPSRPGQTPSVAPQMIQRYSRTPSYRQERRTISTSIGESNAEDVGETMRGGSSGDSNQGGMYSRSWQARTEARQAMIANAMQRGSLGGMGSGSPGNVSGKDFATSSPGKASVAVQRSPSSASSASLRASDRRGSIHDLVDMIDSRTQAAARSTPRIQPQNRRPGLTPTQKVLPIGSSSSRSAADRVGPRVFPEQHSASSLGDNFPTHDHSQSISQSHQIARATEGLGTSPGVMKVAPNTSSPGVMLSRSAVDELLAKMSISVNRLTGPAVRPRNSETKGQIPTSGPASSLVPRSSSPTSDQHIEGGYGATSSARQIANPQRPQMGRGTGPLSPSSIRRVARLTSSRSQSSFELYSPDAPVHHLHSSGDRMAGGRSSSSFDEHLVTGGSGGDHACFDGIGLVNFEEEEPAGRLELHSEPGTPHYSFARSNSNAIGLASQPRSGSIGANAARDLAMEGGLGGLGPTDAERLRSFGEELGSTRGRRNLSPWTRSHRGGTHPPSSATPSPITPAAQGTPATGAFSRTPSMSSGPHPHSLGAQIPRAISPAPSPGTGNSNGNGGGDGSSMNFSSSSNSNSTTLRITEREREYRERRERREASDQAWREYQRQRELNRDW